MLTERGGFEFLKMSTRVTKNCWHIVTILERLGRTVHSRMVEPDKHCYHATECHSFITYPLTWHGLIRAKVHSLAKWNTALSGNRTRSPARKETNLFPVYTSLYDVAWWTPEYLAQSVNVKKPIIRWERGCAETTTLPWNQINIRPTATPDSFHTLSLPLWLCKIDNLHFLRF